MATENIARTGQTDETDRLISSDKVEGTTVYNRNRDNIGSIDHLMIDKVSGQVESSVLARATARFRGTRSLRRELGRLRHRRRPGTARKRYHGSKPTPSRIGLIGPTPSGSMSIGRWAASRTYKI